MKAKPSTFVSILLLSVTVFTTTSLHAQTRAAYLDEEAGILLPTSYDSSRRYPLLVWLPYTGGSATDFFRKHEAFLPLEDVVVLLPQGIPVSTDYLPNFLNYVGWYEERLLADIARVRERYNIDGTRIAIGGFSLGGDLSWALINRNPKLFSGAVMAGTRASYPTSQAGLKELKAKNFLASFFIGSAEDPNRYAGIGRAAKALENAGISTYYEEIPGGRHVSGKLETFAARMLIAAGFDL